MSSDTYVVIIAGRLDGPAGLVAVVNERIRLGWEPCGGIACTKDTYGVSYTWTQAMTRLTSGGLVEDH